MTNELPKHRRVYTALRHDILVGKYSADGRFPSEGMLMRRFAVSRITIRQAMSDLKKEGFLEARSGSGTYLSALARHASGLIGLVIPDYSTNAFFKQLGDALVASGKTAGYTMLLGELPGRSPAARAHEAISLANEYARRKVAGVIIEPVELMPDSADLTQEILSAFDELEIPVVLVDRDVSPFTRSPYDLVGIDNLTSGFTLGKHLIARGAKRLGFLMPPHSASTNLQRMLGVAGAVIDSGLSWSNRNILCLDIHDDKALKKALTRKDAPDVLVCHNDLAATRLSRLTHVAGFDGLSDSNERPYPTVRQPIAELAQTALSTLLERIQKPHLLPRQILLDTSILPARD